jgi:ribosomal protein S6--L-glutamate ligase
MPISPAITILGSRGGWHTDTLLHRCQQRGLSSSVIGWPELGSEILAAGPQFHPRPLEQTTAVLVRGMPSGTLEQVITRMNILGQLNAAGRRVLNQPTALETAIDKYLTIARLASAGLPVPRTAVVQSAGDLRRFAEACGGTAVVKPLFGSNGHGLSLFSATATELPEPLLTTGVALAQEPISHDGWDVRILLVGDEPFAMKRVACPGEWRTNIARGGKPYPFVAPADWIDLARQAATTVGAELAGVDLLPSRDGAVWLLEVNAVPGWQALQSVTSTDIASAVLDLLVAGSV